MQPTTRQREYLSFIKAFTDRWGVPPSFEEIGRHFHTTTPAVNGMIKALEARGFLARVPGGARTLRVLLPDDELQCPAPAAAATTTGLTPGAAVQMASAVIERLVPVLKGIDHQQVNRALWAVAEALDIALCQAGASDEQRDAAQHALCRVADIARGGSPETRPGRRLPWWRRPP